MSTKRYNTFLSILKQALAYDDYEYQGDSNQNKRPSNKENGFWIIDYYENILKKVLYKPMDLDSALSIANTLNETNLRGHKLFLKPPFHVDEIKNKKAFTGKDFDRNRDPNLNLYIVRYIPDRIDNIKNIPMSEGDANIMLGNLNIMTFPHKPFYKKLVKKAGKVTERESDSIDSDGVWVIDYNKDFLDKLKTIPFSLKNVQRIISYLEPELSGAFSGKKIR